MVLKFIYSEKATKFCKIFTLLLSDVVPVKRKVKISQNFVTFLEYLNFNAGSIKHLIFGRTRWIIICLEKKWPVPLELLVNSVEKIGQQHRFGNSRKTRYIRPHTQEQANFRPTVAHDLSKSIIWYSWKKITEKIVHILVCAFPCLPRWNYLLHLFLCEKQ